MTRDPTPERVPDWLLGGRVRRRIFAALAAPAGAAANQIAKDIDAGPAFVYEVLRALKPINAVESTGTRGHYRLTKTGVGEAIRNLLDAGAAFSEKPVSRPSGRVKRE